MKESDVNDWLHSECVSILQSTSLLTLSTPNNHVGIAEDRDDQTYPFIGIRGISSTSQSAGIGSGDMYVDSVNYSNGTADSVTFRREPTLRVELVPVTDNDQQLRDDLVDELVDHFSTLGRLDDYPADVEEVDVDEATVQGRPSEFVYADGVPLDVDYNRYVTKSVAAAETVNVDIDASDTVDDDTDDVEAYSESF
jgi:hypothetical protein